MKASMNQPNTWNELMDAGYVMELSDSQVKEAKKALKQLSKEIQKARKQVGGK